MARRHATTTALFLALLLGAQLACGEEPSKQPDTASTPAAVSSERAALPERSQAEALALQERLPQGEQQLLKAGEESFLALWLPANKGEAQGVVILLPGAGETADWPQAIGPLRSKLPNAGWHTLSLTLPDPLAAAEPITEDSKPAASTGAEPEPQPQPQPGAAAPDQPAPAEPANSQPASVRETPEQHAERVLARVQAGIELAQQQKPASIILLGHGTGGYWAARYLSEHASSPIKNVILVAPELPQPFNPQLSELLPKLQLAVGDFYYRDLPLARDAARQRLQASKRQASPSYIQIAMAALPGDPATEQEQLYRRIRGWLSLQVQAQPAASKP
jgi:pimeloyl-ACP methyl ester carboxylesterase